MIRIKEILKEKRLTQVELAHKLGVTPVGLNKMINGNPTIDTMQRIADALNVEVRDLFASKLGDDQPLGFVQYKGEIHKITSTDDLKGLLAEDGPALS